MMMILLTFLVNSVFIHNNRAFSLPLQNRIKADVSLLMFLPTVLEMKV